MNADLRLLGLGLARPHLRGLSSTVPGLNQCHVCKYPEIQSDMVFGPNIVQASYISYLGWWLGGFGSVPSVGGVSIGSMVTRIVIGVGVY
jgi:hypothetical protein